MSRSNWGEGIAPKLGFGFAVVLATAAIGWGWNYGLAQEFAYEQQAREAHADQTKNGCYQIAQAKTQSPTVKKPDGEPCTPSEEAQKENDNRRDYADLVAQRSSALWAKIMGIAALIGMGLSLVGVALVWTTFRETRKANGIAGDIGFKQLRAYVTAEQARITFGHFYGDDENHEAVEIMLHNSGSTPALGVSVAAKKYTARDGTISEAMESFDLPDIGGQARQSVVVPWYNRMAFHYSTEKPPILIEGLVIYTTAIPDDTGNPVTFTQLFKIEPRETERSDTVKVDIVRMPRSHNF